MHYGGGSAAAGRKDHRFETPQLHFLLHHYFWHLEIGRKTADRHRLFPFFGTKSRFEKKPNRVNGQKILHRLCVIVGYFDRGLWYSRCEYNVKSFCVRRSDQPKQDLAASAGSEASAKAWPGASAEYRSFGYSPMLRQFTDASVFYRSFGFQPKQITSNIGCPKFHSNFDIPLLSGMAWDIRLIFGVLKVWMKSFFTCI